MIENLEINIKKNKIKFNNLNKNIYITFFILFYLSFIASFATASINFVVLSTILL